LAEPQSAEPASPRFEYRFGADWSDDPAIFINATVARKDPPPAALQQLAENTRIALLRFVQSDEIGLHPYLNFAR
jgi:hypothetical protein